MKSNFPVVLPVICAAAFPASAAPGVDRCGWFDNPTPQNVYLIDRDRTWTISEQGGYSMRVDWPWPSFAKREFVRTNGGSYGYGCVCMRVDVDLQAGIVTHVYSARSRALAACRADKAIRDDEPLGPEGMIKKS